MLNNKILISKTFKNKSIVLVVLVLLLLLIQGCSNTNEIEVWFFSGGAKYDTVIVNDKATLPVEPVKEGYIFCGWYFDDNTFNDRLTVESFKDNLLTTNKSVYAKWVKVNGVNNTDIILDTFEKRTDDYYLHVKNDIDTINLDELITISPASKYIISTDSVFTNTIDKVVNLNIGDNTYYVKVINENTLENVIYTLSIYRNKMFEVTLISYDNNVYKVIEVEEDSLLTLKDITREHYTFDGWDYDLTKPVKDNLTIHAKWDPILYEITYISGDKVIKKELLPYNSDISYIANKDYNTFDGWYSDETYSYSVTKVTDNMSVYAKWIPIEYNVTCDLSGGIGTTSYTYNYYTVLTLDKPDKEGYTFIGWKYNGVTFEDIKLKNSYGDKEYTAVFEANIYTITYDVNGGDSLICNTQEVVYNNEYILITPIRTGYEFIDWYNGSNVISANKWNIASDITLVAKWSSTYKENGNTYIDYGSYPQSVVLDNTLISKLNTLTTINSKGYYEYNGKEYAKVVAKPYGFAINDYKFPDNETDIISGTTYYFLVEPIKWRVLSDTSDEYFLLSEYILDKHEFYPNDVETRTIDGNTIYPNNYEYSTIREWLNNNFYNKAFNNNEKELIKETLVDNSVGTTDSNDNPYTCNNTLDKVFLLSFKDMTNTLYGFDSYKSREAKITDYARTIGCYMSTDSSYYGNGRYYLRTPYINSGNNVYSLGMDGGIHGNLVVFNDFGMRVAFKIQK